MQALAPHLGGGGEEQARKAAERLPHTLLLGDGRTKSAMWAPPPSRRTCPKRERELDFNAIGAQASPPPHLPQALQTLDLAFNAISAAGATAIGRTCPTLQTLNLARNEIGCGRHAIAPHLPQALPRWLDNNAIGAAGTTAIAPHCWRCRCFT